MQLAVVRDVEGVFRHDFTEFPVVEDGQEAFADDVAVEGFGYEDSGGVGAVGRPVEEVVGDDGGGVGADGLDDAWRWVDGQVWGDREKDRGRQRKKMRM